MFIFMFDCITQSNNSRTAKPYVADNCLDPDWGDSTLPQKAPALIPQEDIFLERGSLRGTDGWMEGE